MARAPRSIIEGGYYHVLTRGNDRRKLFRYRQDYFLFLRTVEKYLKKYPVDIVNYCLMPNHLHMLIRVNQPENLPKFMQGVLQVYACYFRKKYNSAGFIFQNRYKSIHIDNDAYLLECGRYIERNPLRAKIISNIQDYPWSSFLYYTSGIKDDIIKSSNPLYLLLANTEVERRQLYFKYILEERPYEHIVDNTFRMR
jgi:putative transposase